MYRSNTLLVLVVMLIFSATMVLAQEPDNLLGHWAFDGALVDSAGDVDGTFKSALDGGTLKFTEGRFGQAVDLDSVYREFVILGDSTDLNFGDAQDFSISVWIKSTGWMNDAAIISNKDWDSGSNTGYVIAGEGGGSGAWQWNFAGGENRSNRVDFDPPGPEMSDGEWHNICVTHDRDGLAKFYFDGLIQGAEDISESMGSIDAGLPTIVGADGVESAFWQYWWNGAIDELRIYSDVLTMEEVEKLAVLTFKPELIGHWSFDYTLEDMVGEAHGVYDGYELSYTEGLEGGALSLDGLNDFVVLGDTLHMNFGEDVDFTVALWVRTTGWKSDPVIIGNKDWGSGGNTGWLIAGGSDTWQWNQANENRNRTDYDPAGPKLNDGAWHHLCVTLDRKVDSVAIFYFDGIVQDTVDISGSAGSIYSGYPVTIGQDGTTEYGHFFKGDIDELMIYNYPIDADQVAKIGEKTPEPMMVGHWTFDGTLEDMAGDADGVYKDQFGPKAAKYVEGRYGQAIDLNQSVIRFHSLALGDENDLNFGYSTDFSVALWVNTTGWAGDAPIITNKDWGSGGNPGWLIAGEGGGSGTWQWNYNATESASKADFDPDGPELSDGEWHHLCVSHDRDGMATFYFDGKKSGEVDISTIAGSVDAGYPTVIGNDGTQGYGDYFDGLIDEVKVYNYALKNLDVAKLAENPFIESVTDVPNDQGGYVYVRFYPSLLEKGPNQPGHSYFVQRKDGDIWTSVGSAPATNDSIYQIQVTTLADSASDGDGMTDFRLITSTTEGTWISKSVSGYSVDNIEPSVPQNLDGTIEDGNVVLSWAPNEEEDFKYYGIYRSAQAEFDPDTMNAPTYTTTDSRFEDGDISDQPTYYYRVAAFDHSGNQSAYSTQLSVVVSSIRNGNGIPMSFQLHQNYPNPFNPVTSINYDLPERSVVKISVYNIKGQKVATLVDNFQEPGYHSIDWNATSFSSGVYFYDIKATNFSATKKMMLVK